LGGGSIRQAHLFDTLASAFPVDLLTIGPIADERVRAAAATVTELPRRWPPRTSHPLGRRALELAITLASPYPAVLYSAAPARRALAAAIAEHGRRHDLVCVEHETLAPLAQGSHGGRWLITLHHLLSAMIASELERAPGRRQRWFRKRDLRKAERLERWTVRSFDRCIACSEEDAAALHEIADGSGVSRVEVIPNGVDLALFKPTPVPQEPRVLLPGRLTWGPNVDGAVWFCTEIWPAIRAAVPDATFVLAGRSPLPEVRALERLPGVSVCADVPSMVPYFESARVVVVPLRAGTGTRLKALEAMAAARPVVGTAVGLAGIGVRDGLNAVVADQPEKLAAGVVEVLRRDDLASALGQSGRTHVERHFGWDQIGARFVALAAELLEEPRRS
jgi:glycosyltransferase involved in cell wall biosynthesis